jgi:hypothetical protein
VVTAVITIGTIGIVVDISAMTIETTGIGVREVN